jgi:hypothetical protein
MLLVGCLHFTSPIFTDEEMQNESLLLIFEKENQQDSIAKRSVMDKSRASIASYKSYWQLLLAGSYYILDRTAFHRI